MREVNLTQGPILGRLVRFSLPMIAGNMLQTQPELMTLMREYVSAVFVGIFFVFLYNFSAYLLRAMGNSLAALLFLAASAVLNIVLDIWFVMGLSMGVAGAAWATVISQAVSGLGIMAYSFAKLPQLRRGGENWDWERFGQIVRNDVATGIQQSVMNFGILMIQGLVNSFGTVIMAAFAAAVKIDTLAYMPAQEFGNAYSLFVSQNFGAGEHERIRKGHKAILPAVRRILRSDFLWDFSVGSETYGVLCGRRGGRGHCPGGAVSAH